MGRVTRGEKDMYLQNAIAMGALDWLKGEFEELKEVVDNANDRRVLSTVDTYLNKVNAEILMLFDDDKERSKFQMKTIKKVKDRISIVRTTHGFGEEEDAELDKFFVNFYVPYVAVRDAVNYYDQNPKIDNKVITGIKSAKTRLKNAFEKHAKDAGLDWEHIITPLENKIGKYEYEAKLIIA